MTFLMVIIAVVFLYKITRRPPRVIQARNIIELPEPESDADRQKRELAAADIERWKSMKETYRRLLDALEEELESCTNPQRRTVILNKIAVTERKTHDLDHRIEKLYYTANAVNY